MTSLPERSSKRTPFVAFPKPLLTELLALDGDLVKVFLRLVELARHAPGMVDGFHVDAGECLVFSQQSKACWGAIRFAREHGVGRALRPFIRRRFQELKDLGLINTTEAKRVGRGNGPLSVVDRGHTPTIVRFLKCREIMWPEARREAYPGTRNSAQSPAHLLGPIVPADLTTQAAASEEEPPLVRPGCTRDARAAAFPLVLEFQAALEPRLGSNRVRMTADVAQWTAMQSELERVGVEGAVLASLDRAARRRAGMNAIGSLWWFLPILRELRKKGVEVEATPPTDRTKRAIVAAEESCFEWGATLEVLSEQIRPDLVEQWLLPLRATTSAGDLLLQGPNPYHRNFVRDQYGELLERTLASVLADIGSPPLRIRFVE